MTISKSDRLAKVHAEAIHQFNRIQSAVRDERLQCLQDRRFCSIAGAQWEGDLSAQFENKPKFEVNKIELAVLRILNEYRNNRIAVDFVPKDGTKADTLADACNGLYRADEQDSGADEAYDNAFDEATKGGIGGWRLRAVYEDEEDPENETQRIRIEPIYDADSCVFFDLDAKRQDKSDAKCCFVLSSQTPEGFKDEWDEDPTTWPKEVQARQFDWVAPDLVFVAEYYKVEDAKDTIHVYEDLQGEETKIRQSALDEDDTREETLLATGHKLLRSKPIRVRKIHKYIMSGGGILEDSGFVAGQHIPIVPNYGKRSFVDGVERCMGHVRLAKDAQRLKNMQLSKLGEISAYTGLEKPIFYPEQIAAHAVMWANDNISNFPYLVIDPIRDQNGQIVVSGPIAYTKPPMIPPAMAALLQITEQDMQDILGNPAGAEKMVSNIASKTVEMIQQRIDIQTFIYVSNFAKAKQRSGVIWLSMAMELYVEQGRKMKTVGAQGETGTLELMRPVLDEASGKDSLENDLTRAKMDVAVEVGPSSSTRRDSTVRSLTGLIGATQDPDTQQILMATIMMNMEGEGLTETRDFFRMKLVRMGAIKPTDDEKKEMEAAKANQPEDPNTTYLKAAAEEATANATQSRVKTIETIASADLKRAQAMETLAGIELDERKQLMEMSGKIQPFNPQAAADQDVIPARISIPEARHLKAEGGAGVVNPATGEMHFYNERGDGSDGNQGGGRNDAGGADGKGGDGGDKGGGRDLNAERAARFGGSDVEGLARGEYRDGNVGNYGINEGAGSLGYNAKRGLLGSQVIGPLGFAAGITHTAGTPAVNGGGWSESEMTDAASPLGSSNFSREPGTTIGGNREGGSGNGLPGAFSPQQISQMVLGGLPQGMTGQIQPGRQIPTESPIYMNEAPLVDPGYKSRIPVDEWAKLAPNARQEAMNAFWQQF